MYNNLETEFITQHNLNNELLIQYFLALKNHSFLYDMPLGVRLVPDTYLPPVLNKFTGYAGG